MHFEPWMFAAMEDEGIMDNRPGRINRVAKYLAEQGLEYLSKVFGITQNEAHRAGATRKPMWMCTLS